MSNNELIHKYLKSISTNYNSGKATEHTYRGALADLVHGIMAGTPDILITNEPKRIECGAPDYVITKKEIPIGYIEAKDIGVKLTSPALKEQFNRYRTALDNLIITDYLDFHFYKDGECFTSIRIASETAGNKISLIPDNFAEFENLIKNFCERVTQSIKSPQKLAELMANKSRLLANVIEKTLIYAEENNDTTTLSEQFQAFKKILIHDITIAQFADFYAQTITYGMFAARLHDNSLDSFSRAEAATLIPKTNPFLRKLFQYIAGYDIEPNIVWIINDLADLFRATDIKKLLQGFGKATKQENAIIHFYETFLAAYDPALRKARGVWYTPAPVVNFIVRAVDDILKSEFGISEGLTSNDKIKIKVEKNNKKVEEEVHKVQILDPATGTGTFLSEVIRHIHKGFAGQEGIWGEYVENDLIPRLNGFELLMASYAMAHLQLDLLLQETGFQHTKSTREQRFRIYLTNSLEEHDLDAHTLFANWLSAEANEASAIKRDTSVMVVMGNPPYSGISQNNGEWISGLINDYKYIDGVHFNERKHWLNDDYVKFIRFGEHFVNKNGEGVLAYINNHSFIDNPTFRGMRWHLLNTFDDIYIIDLHGNSKKKEVRPLH